MQCVGAWGKWRTQHNNSLGVVPVPVGTSSVWQPVACVQLHTHDSLHCSI
jgi:hypothetical protein